MAGESIFTGKSVDEAIAEGLRTLGLTTENAEIEVLNRGSRGIFGLGSEPAQVRITKRTSAAPARPSAAPAPAAPAPAAPAPAPVVPAPVPAPAPSAPAPVAPAPVAPAPVAPAPVAPAPVAPAPVADEQSESAAPPAPVADEPPASPRSDSGEPDDADAGDSPSTPEEDAQLAALAAELLNKLVELMGFEAEVIAEWRAPDADNEHRYLLLDLQGSDLSPLIGRRGDTLGNMQYLVRLMINQRLHRWKNIVVDVEGYRQRRIEHLSQLALRLAQQVAQTGRPMSLEPMPANERRIIHLTLRSSTDVFTESVGEGARRKVQILPRK